MTDESDEPLVLGRNFQKLKETVYASENREVIQLENDIRALGQNISKLNFKLNQIETTSNQSKINMIGTNYKQFKNDSKMRTTETAGICDIKEEIGSNFRILNEKLNEIKSIEVDDEFLPVLCSTFNQLETSVQKIQMNIKCHENLSSQQENEIDSIIELGKCSKSLEEKLVEMKNIFYKRYQTKFKELMINRKLKYENDIENYKKVNNFNFQLQEYSKYCAESHKSIAVLRSLFHEKLQNDFEFRHYFKRFLLEYQNNLFKLFLNDSSDYIPKSKLYTQTKFNFQSNSNDKKYNLFEDIEQLNLIHDFLRKIINLSNIQEFNDLTGRDILMLNSLLKNVENSNRYLILLKESYLVFIRDHILILYDREENIRNKDILLKINDIKQFNEDSLKLINDSERQMKKLFLRKFRDQTWNEKLIIDEKVEINYKIIDFTMKNDAKPDELKSQWLRENDLQSYSEYENYVTKMICSLTKGKHLYEISQLYNNKRPCLNIYLKKSLEFLNQSILIDKVYIQSSGQDLTNPSELRKSLRFKYELHGLINLNMASRFSFACYDKFNYLKMATNDFLRFDELTIHETDVQYHEENFIELFKKAFELNNNSSMNIYENILKINPYFFRAQYEKLLKFYEINDCSTVHHFHRHKKLEDIDKSKLPLLTLFKHLINTKKHKRKSPHNEPSDFVNKTIQVRVKNHQNQILYLKLVGNEYSYKLKCNSEEQLINLLQYGKISINKIKNDYDESLKLKYQLINYDLIQIISNLTDKIEKQESNFLILIDLYKKLELSNEFEYKRLDERFLKLLPETRLNFIRITSNDFQRVCEISRAINEFKNFSKSDVHRSIVDLKFQRANIYRRKNLFYLEECELTEILNNQKKNCDHNPMIYYRLSYLNKFKGNLQISMNYINLAKKKYYEKINKKIFGKINKMKYDLAIMENQKTNNELIFAEKNRMNLFQILNLVLKTNLYVQLSIKSGFQLYPDIENSEKRISLVDCLFYHLLENVDDIEEYLHKNMNSLTKKYFELKDTIKQQRILNRDHHVKMFNKTFQSQFKCFFVNKGIDLGDFKYLSNEIPIVLIREKNTSNYQTIKSINHLMLIANLITSYNAKTDLKSICSKFLNEEISKNILIDNNENRNIDTFIKSMVECENMKIFNENIVYYLKTNDYNDSCFDFWSTIADFEYNVDLRDTLGYFKELFRESIEEYRLDEEEKHKSALQLIDDLIEKNQDEQKSLRLFNRFKEEILRSLGHYENISSCSKVRKKIDEILASNCDLIDKIKRLISTDGLNINLQFQNTDEETNFYEYLKNDSQTDMVYKIFLVIEDILSKPKIENDKEILTIESYNIVIGDLMNKLENTLKDSKIRQVKFYGTNIFIDASFQKHFWHGIDLFFASDIIGFVKDEKDTKISIDVSGKKGQDVVSPEDRLHATRESEDGMDGLPGGNGEAGENGGHIYLIAKATFEGKENIEKLITSGGDGGKGGNGGNAGNGHDGNDGEDAEGESGGFLEYGYVFKQGKVGTKGGNGGMGGDAGLGGLGGHAGIVYIEEKAIVITDSYASLIISEDKSAVSAEDGSPGRGGKGGTGGLDGNDILYHKPTPLSKNEVYRGHIEVISTKMTIWTCYVDFEYKKRPRKANGIDNVSGKSASAQLNAGKTRNKTDTKHQSNEQQIKNDSNQVINRNHQESKNLSQNITNSLNLLKDQMIDISDERQLKVKTHELSNSMLANAHKVAQESLAANAIKTKVKMENTILKTFEIASMKNDKLTIQGKLKFDESTKEVLEIEKGHFITNLQKQYRTKIESFHKHLNKLIRIKKNEIKLLKFQGKNILFRIDIRNLEATYIIGKKNIDQIDVSNLLESYSSNKQDLSSLANNSQTILYNSTTKQHEPFLLEQYFQQFTHLKMQKQLLIRIKRQLNEFNINQFIDDLCLEYGNKRIVKKKLKKFDKILAHDFNNASQTFNFHNSINDILTSNEQTDKRKLAAIQNTTNSLILNETNNFKKPDLNQCSPIYHEQDKQSLLIEIHPLEELINDYLESKEKNLELIVRMLKGFVSIIEDNQQNLLCKRKVDNFLQFLLHNLVHIQVDFEYGYLFKTISKTLNYIQINYSSLSFNNSIGKLKSIVFLKAKQFNSLNNQIEKIDHYFQYKRTEFDMDIKMINYVQNNRKEDIFRLFEEYCQFNDDIDQNEHVHKFIQRLHIEEKHKLNIRVLLKNFHNYLKSIQEFEYNYLKSNRNIFREKLKIYLTQEKSKIKSQSNDLSLKRNQCQTIIYRLYKILKLDTNINVLNNVHTSFDLNVDQFIGNLKKLYDDLRLEEISKIKTDDRVPKKVNVIDFNENICQIVFISRQLKYSDRIKIKTGYQIFIQREEDLNEIRFEIYFRRRNNREIDSFLLKQSKLIEILKNLRFNTKDMILLKEENREIYKLTYQEIESTGGFTKHLPEQIESFQNVKEILYEKLSLLKKYLPTNYSVYIEEEINLIIETQSPEMWSMRIYLIFNNISIISDIKDKFPEDFKLISTEKIGQLILTTSDVFNKLNDLIKQLLSRNKQDIFTTFYKCLSTLDFLLIKIMDNQLNSIEDVSKDLMSNVKEINDLEKQILNEILWKNDQILKEYFYNEVIRKFDEKFQEILNGIKSLSCERERKKEMKKSIQVFFNDLFSNIFVKLFISIDQFYIESSPKSKISRKHQLYENLLTLADDFLSRKTFEWTNDKIDVILDNFTETCYAFIEYLEKHSLLFVSGILDIEHAPIQKLVEKLLSDLKEDWNIVEKCPLRFLTNVQFEANNYFKNEILLTKFDETQIKIKFRTLTENKINIIVLKQDDNRQIFDLLNNPIDEYYNQNTYHRFYLLIKSKNGLINKKQHLFYEQIFTEILLNQIVKNIDKISNDTFNDYLHSFEIILRNSSLLFDILIIFDEYYQNQLKQIQNETLKTQLKQFYSLISEKYDILFEQIKLDFVSLMLKIQHKNQILNVTWNYLKNKSGTKANVSMTKLDKNKLNKISSKIITIFEENQFQIKDLIDCYQQLNDSITRRPMTCLETFEHQLNILQSKARLFTKNLDFQHNCPRSDLFENLNETITKSQSTIIEFILNLLENILQHDDLPKSVNYQSIVKKILLNLNMNDKIFDSGLLSKSEFERKDLVYFYEQLKQSMIERSMFCFPPVKSQSETVQNELLLFMENVDFPINCPIKSSFEHFNRQFIQSQESVNDLIFNLLKYVLTKKDSCDFFNYQSVMKKILLNLQINCKIFNLEFLSKIETMIKTYEKSSSIKRNYLNFIIERIKTEFILRYNDELTKYKNKTKRLNSLIDEILNLFWLNISSSDLFNKEREKIYLHITIEKLLKLSNENSNHILNEILNKIKDLQKDSNKKRFTNEIHKYMNNKINQEITVKAYQITIPIKISDKLTKQSEHILKNSYEHESNERILNELSLLFEALTDQCNAKTELNEFFQSFTNVFKYFSWRLCQDNSNTRQNTIDTAVKRLNSSIKIFKMKIKKFDINKPEEKYAEFYKFEKLFYLRTHESQLQQELNDLQSESEIEPISCEQILEYWSKRLYSMSKNDRSITKHAQEIIQTINENIFKEKPNIDEEAETTTTDDRIDEETVDQIQEKVRNMSDEDKKNLKINLKDKIHALQQFSSSLINDEQTWEKKEQLITFFDSTKEKLIMDYMKSIYDQEYAKLMDYETFKNSIVTKHFQEILAESYSNEWDQEFDNLSMFLFVRDLLELYELNFDVLIRQYDFIEEQMNKNTDDDILKEKWNSETKNRNNSMKLVNLIRKYSKERSGTCRFEMSLDGLIKEYIKNVKIISDVMTSIDTLQFLVGSEQFRNLIQSLQRRLFDSKSSRIELNKLSDLFYLLSSLDDFDQTLLVINNYKVEKWLFCLHTMKIKMDLKVLCKRYLDELNFNDLNVENLDDIDLLFEEKYKTNAKRYENVLNTVLNSIGSIELDDNLELNEKEIFFHFIRIRLSFEVKRSSNNLIKSDDLNNLFNKYFMEINIIHKIINSLNNKSLEFNDHLIIEDIHSKSLNNLVPYLTRFWIIEQLKLDKKALEDEATKIIQYFELIKMSYSEEKMFELIDVIKSSCQNESFIPHIILDLLMNISTNDWILNKDIIEIMKTNQMEIWEDKIENYMKEKRLKKRDLAELINLMKEDKNNLNISIKDYLNSSTIFEDLRSIKEKLNEKIHKDICKSVEKWDVDDIQHWSDKIKGNKLLSDKEQIQNAIVVVNQAMYLLTEKKVKLRDTQLLALWLFLNPDLNKRNVGCLAQISTGEGKSIIVAGLAAIKALGLHRVDIITSSSVLAIRDSEKFQPFYTMFHLTVSNNCDRLCEEGDGQRSAEDIRKFRYNDKHGPVDIIYGECSCFERDILLTEFNKNDENVNIIGKRLIGNCVPSVIIDEVDSMLLDKANMVLYLSYNIDTLKSLERIFISIWQTVNHQQFDQVSRSLIDDDLIQLVSNMIIEQINDKVIDIPKYESYNYDYINMDLFVKRRIPIWVRSAFHVKEMIPNDTYIVTQDTYDKSSKSNVKITVMDKDTGTEQSSTRWSHGVHQFLQLKHTRRLTPESLKAVFISNMSFFKRYQYNITGLTGSLGSYDEQNLLNKVYNVRFFELPRFKCELFREIYGSVHSEQGAWLEAIKNALDREIYLKSINRDRRRAVLIISENVRSVLIIKEYLSNSYPNAKVYKSAYEKFEVNELHPGDVIIATNLAGRGTDLDTSVKLEENGGLHVITTFLPTNIRIEMQAFGRTARKGSKGTGEYIVFTRIGLTIQQLKQWRNLQEKERLDSFLTNDLPKIKIEEDLLQGFDDGELSCIGFTQLYQQMERKFSLDNSQFYYGKEYIQYQLNSLKNRWAFWLDSMTEQINMINIIGKHRIIEQFHQFQLTIEKDFEKNDFKRLIIEPTEFIKLGKYYRDNENWSKAVLCYEQASKDQFYSFADYYRCSCEQNINYGEGISRKRIFKHDLLNVKTTIDKEMQFLSNAAHIVTDISEKGRRLGFANYGNEYDAQVKEKLTISNIFSGTIINTIGSTIDAEDLTIVKYFCDKKKAAQLFSKLQAKQFIKPIRISKTLHDVDLPSIFNNKRTKEDLAKYLRKKIDKRKGSGYISELDFETFKKELKDEKVFLPYLDEFIILLEKQNGFIKTINHTEASQIFIFKDVVEEKLAEKQFPNDLSIYRQHLFDCLKEMTKEKNFKGNKTEIFSEVKRLIKSENQMDLTEQQFNQFYKFLKENALIDKVSQYSVIKENILNKNENLKDDYFYADLYDFERHYTDKFKKFELLFRRNFLKIILTEQRFDENNSYFTIRGEIDSTDFEMHKTIDDAIDYLWSYLKSNSIIKLPCVNIGLIDSTEVNDKREEIKKEIELFLAKDFTKEQKEELKEAVESVFNIIDQTIGEIKKLPDDKTIASYLQIKTNYFLNHKKHVPDALDEFIELALDVVFQLQEKKDPPKWYEIATVIALGVTQVILGVMAKAFIPIAGQLIGEFLISTGCDDVMFGMRSAVTGEFSWDKYWQHKKQSMITSAVTAVVFVGASYAKNARKLGMKKAWEFQKLTGAQKLCTAASTLSTTANIGSYIGKEITKTLIQTGLSELASMSIDHLLNTISNNYEIKLTKTITSAVESKSEEIKSEMQELFRLCEGNDSSLRIIDDCINRKLNNLPEATFLRNFVSRSSPVMQGLGRALADGQGTIGLIQRLFTSYAPTLMNLGINIYEVTNMIEGFMKNLLNDLKDAKKRLETANKTYELTKSQIEQFESFQKNKISQISNNLSETFNQKLKHGIIAPILNFAANKLISKSIERLAGADRIEQLANKFELIHAASNPNDTKLQYADELQIFVAEAKPTDIETLKRCGGDPKKIKPVNGDGQTLEKIIGLFGSDVEIFFDDKNAADGTVEIYVKRPTSKQYCESVRGDKPAGLHEQEQIPKVLGCTITKDETVSNEEKFTLTQKGSDRDSVSFVIKDNPEGIKHAMIIHNGVCFDLKDNTGHINNCFYIVVLVANEMSKGIPFEVAVKILEDKNVVKNLRYKVSLEMKNNQNLLNEFEWTNRTNLETHYKSLTGLRLTSNDRSLAEFEASDKDAEYFIEWVKKAKGNKDRPDQFESQKGLKAVSDKETLAVSYHHIVAFEELLGILKDEIGTLKKSQNPESVRDGNSEKHNPEVVRVVRSKIQNYLNDPRNEAMKKLLINEMRQTRRDQDLTKHNNLERETEKSQDKDKYLIRKACVWNPNIVIPGPEGAKRKFDPDHGGDGTSGSRIDKELIPNHLKRNNPGLMNDPFPKNISELVQRLNSPNIQYSYPQNSTYEQNSVSTGVKTNQSNSELSQDRSVINTFELISIFNANERGGCSWERDKTDKRKRFTYNELSQKRDHPYLNFKLQDDQQGPNGKDERKLNFNDGTLQ